MLPGKRARRSPARSNAGPPLTPLPAGPAAEDPYVYPGTRVLCNLWGTRDPAAQASLEGKATTIALTRLRRNPVAGR